MENGSKNAAGSQEILYISKNFKDFAKKLVELERSSLGVTYMQHCTLINY